MDAIYPHTQLPKLGVFFNNTANLAVFLIADEVKVSVYCVLCIALSKA